MLRCAQRLPHGLSLLQTFPIRTVIQELHKEVTFGAFNNTKPSHTFLLHRKVPSEDLRCRAMRSFAGAQDDRGGHFWEEGAWSQSILFKHALDSWTGSSYTSSAKQQGCASATSHHPHSPLLLFNLLWRVLVSIETTAHIPLKMRGNFGAAFGGMVKENRCGYPTGRSNS